MSGQKQGSDILIVLPTPTAKEDFNGKFDPSYREHLLNGLSEGGINVEEVDVAYAASCGTGRSVDNSNVHFCNPFLRDRIAELSPRVIIPLGPFALEGVIMGEWKNGVGLFDRWVGRKIPLNGVWVCPTYGTYEISNCKTDLVERIATGHIADACSMVDIEVPARKPYENDVEILQSKADIASAIKDFHRRGKPVAIDYETNCLKPDYPGAKPFSLAIADEERCVSFALEAGILPLVGKFLRSDRNPKIAANVKMEERWTRMMFGHGVSNWIWDTMLAAHSMDNSPGATGLKFQAFVNFGVGTYNDKVEPFLKSGKHEHYNRIHDCRWEDLLLYGGMDAILEYDLYVLQSSDSFWEIKPKHGESMRSGLMLMLEGIQTLSKIEANGIGIDVEMLDETKQSLKRRVSELSREIRNDPLWSIWRKRYGQKSNLRSRDQLKWLVYEHLQFPVRMWTEKGEPSTNAEALSLVDDPFVKSITDMMRYDKALGTFLHGIETETVEGRLHPVFNLHIARTFRSSSDSPNFQNFPVRDKEISKIIRQHFVPDSDDKMIVECDFKGIEVSMSHCYHRDPQFRRDITEPGRDMHRDMAAEVYCVRPEKVSKDMRYGAKNKFVFPQFYGDYYVSCAKALWEWMVKANLETTDGKSVIDILRRKGITELGACDHDEDPVEGTFEKHVQKVEKRFWNERYQVYGKWRKDWHQKYLDRGYFDCLSGFRISGNFARNAVVNYPVQSSAFHCLLWTLNELQKSIEKLELETKLVGQIHDSVIAEVPVSELRKFLTIVERITSVGLSKRYKWLTVPMVIEFEASPPGKSWYEKKEFQFRDGQFITGGPTKDVNQFLEAFVNE